MSDGTTDSSDDAVAEVILVPLDGTDLAERALPVARWATAALGAQLELLAVAVDDDEARTFVGYLDAVGGRLDLSPAATHVPVDPDAAETIRRTAASSPATLVCLASHGWSRTGGPLGSVATVVAAGLGRPVLVVGPDAGPGAPGGAVVACVDGGPASEAVLAPAAAWARALGAPLLVANVYEPVPVTEGGNYHRRHGPEADADAYVAEVAGRVDAPGVDVSGVAVADPISPVDGLLTLLAGTAVQMLVVSTHARTGLSRLLLGSEAARIVHRLPVPVLTVPLSPGVAPL